MWSQTRQSMWKLTSVPGRDCETGLQLWASRKWNTSPGFISPPSACLHAQSPRMLNTGLSAASKLLGSVVPTEADCYWVKDDLSLKCKLVALKGWRMLTMISGLLSVTTLHFMHLKQWEPARQNITKTNLVLVIYWENCQQGCWQQSCFKRRGGGSTGRLSCWCSVMSSGKVLRWPNKCTLASQVWTC